MQTNLVIMKLLKIPKPFRSAKRSSLMVSALDSGSSCSGSGLGRGHCVVLLGKTLYSHGVFMPPPRCING